MNIISLRKFFMKSLFEHDIKSKRGWNYSFEWNWRLHSLTIQFKDYILIAFQFSDYNSI